MSRVERDPERGRAAAAKLKARGVKGILIKAAEQGYITQLACKMPECFCPEELGGACYFEPITDELSDWSPTHEHFPLSRLSAHQTQRAGRGQSHQKNQTGALRSAAASASIVSVPCWTMSAQ